MNDWNNKERNEYKKNTYRQFLFDITYSPIVKSNFIVGVKVKRGRALAGITEWFYAKVVIIIQQLNVEDHCWNVNSLMNYYFNIRITNAKKQNVRIAPFINMRGASLSQGGSDN